MEFESLHHLHPRAIVAFAARCALRVLPLASDPGEAKSLIERAEDFAAGRDDALAARDAARDAALAAWADDDAARAARAAALADALAAWAADDAARADALADALAARADALADARDAALAAARDAARADALADALAAARDADDAAMVAAECDFAFLETACNRGDTIFPLEKMGPLWPQGEPDWLPRAIVRRTKERRPFLGGYPLGARGHYRLVSPKRDGHGRLTIACGRWIPPFPESPSFSLYLRPGNASKDSIRNLLEALSDLHIAAGGNGLEFRSDGMLVCLELAEPSPVPIDSNLAGTIG